MPADRVAAWSEALLSRHSRRSYTGEPAPAAAIETLTALCERFRPYDDARAVFLADPAVDIFTGAVGSYGKVTGTPHVLAMIAGEEPHAALHAGCTGEAAVLEATALGLDTCWVAGFFDRSKADALVGLAPGERILAVSPVGTAVHRRTATERTFGALAGSRQRKPLRTLTEADASWPEWALAAVEAARIAPSAMNRQPWRFRMDGRVLVVSMDSGGQLPVVRKELDCGIAMLHVEIAARARGVEGAWVEAGDGLDLARWMPNEDSR